MRIAVFIKSSSESGGLETQNQLLVEGLRDRGCDVSLFETTDPRDDTQVLEDFRKKHDQQPFDVAISQSAAGTPLAKRKEDFGVPVVVIQHGTLWGSLKTRWRMTPLTRYPLLLFRLIPYALKVYFSYDLQRLKKANAVIAVSQKVKEGLVREYFLPPEKIKVIYNGVNTRLFESSKRFSLNPKPQKTVLYLGRLAAEKGLDVLLQAFQETIQPLSHLTIQLLIVGSGPAFDHLNNRTRELGLADTVEFVGKVPYEETVKYYQQADVFVLPSMANEGLPMTIIEAMAAGLPVAASDIGGIPEAVTDGETGLLVKPGNMDELSTALSKLLRDDELRKKMGQRAREVAKEKFSQETMVLETLKVLESVVR